MIELDFSFCWNTESKIVSQPIENFISFSGLMIAIL